MEKSDHDILIRVETKLEGLTEEVRRSNDNIKEQITNLWSQKVDKKLFEELQDIVNTHTKDIKTYGRLIYIGFGIVITLQFILMLNK